MYVKIVEIAKLCGEKPARNRYWHPRDFVQAVRALERILADNPPDQFCALDGLIEPAASLALLDAVFPVTRPAVVDPKYDNGLVRIPAVQPTPGGAFLQFKVQEASEFTLVEFFVPNKFMDVSLLPNVAPPTVNGNKGVVLKGRAPAWLTGTLGLAYSRYSRHPFVAVYQIGNDSGARVSIRSSAGEPRLGSLIAAYKLEQIRPPEVVPHRGEVWYYEVDGGARPAVIVSRDERNAATDSVIIVPLCDRPQQHDGSLYGFILPAAGIGLKGEHAAVWAECGLITTVRRGQLLGSPRHRVGEETLKRVLRHLLCAVDSD